MFQQTNITLLDLFQLFELPNSHSLDIPIRFHKISKTENTASHRHFLFSFYPLKEGRVRRMIHIHVQTQGLKSSIFLFPHTLEHRIYFYFFLFLRFDTRPLEINIQLQIFNRMAIHVCLFNFVIQSLFLYSFIRKLTGPFETTADKEWIVESKSQMKETD